MIKNTKDKWYKPELTTAKPLNIPDEDIKDSPLQRVKARQGKTIQVGMDKKVILQRVSHDLYGSWQSGIRELYNNEARACRNTIRDVVEASPEIHIQINPTERELIIWGKDSEGITLEVFDECLSILGVSSNHDGEEIGQFGMGFASYTTTFESMIVDTYARANEEKYSFLADSGVEFKILPTVPKFNRYGTRLRGTYSEKINPDRIVELVKELALFSNVPTFIELSEDTNDHSAGLIVCQQFSNGLSYLEAKFDEQYEESTKDIKGKIDIDIEREDFDFHAFLVVYDTKWGNTNKWNVNSHTNQITLLGTPVIADLSTGIKECVSGYVLNIKDERKYKPTADRDRMTDDSIDDIEEEIKAELTEKYAFLKLVDVNDYRERLANDTGWYYDSSIWRDIRYIVDDETTDTIVDTLATHYTNSEKTYQSLQQMMTKNPNKTIIALKSLRKEYMAKLDTVFDDRIYIRLPTRETEGREERISTLRELGVIMGEEYIRENRLRVKRDKTQNGFADVSVRLYSSYHAREYWGSSRYGKPYIPYMLSEVNTNAHNMIMRVKKDDWSNVMEVARQTPFIMVRERKGYNNNVKTYDMLLKETGNTMFYVGNEKKKLKDIAIKHDEQVCVIRLDGEFTIEELACEKQMVITPVVQPTTSEGWNRLIGMLAFHANANNYRVRNDQSGSLLSDIIADEIGDGLCIASDDETNKSLMILRLKRKVGNELPELYELAKQVLQCDSHCDEKKIENIVMSLYYEITGGKND